MQNDPNIILITCAECGQFFSDTDNRASIFDTSLCTKCAEIYDQAKTYLKENNPQSLERIDGVVNYLLTGE